MQNPDHSIPSMPRMFRRGSMDSQLGNYREGDFKSKTPQPVMPPAEEYGNDESEKNKSINLGDIKFEPYVSTSSVSAGSDNDTYSEDIVSVQLIVIAITE